MKTTWRDGARVREVELRAIAPGRWRVRVDDAEFELASETMPDGKLLVDRMKIGADPAERVKISDQLVEIVDHHTADDEGDVQKIGRAHLKKEAPRLASFCAVPREIDALVASALEKDAAKRPRDAFSFAKKLRELKRDRGDRPSEQTRTAVNVLGPESSGSLSTAVRPSAGSARGD